MAEGAACGMYGTVTAPMVASPGSALIGTGNGTGGVGNYWNRTGMGGYSGTASVSSTPVPSSEAKRGLRVMGSRGYGVVVAVALKVW
jgi:hypothetical protein